jgi:hypothetical protein
VWYTDGEGTLYKKTLGKDTVKIAEDVNYVEKVYPTGELLYLKRNTDVKLWDFLEDDMAQGDPACEELRRELREARLESGEAPSPICYYDGEKETVLSQTGAWFCDVASDGAVAAFCAYDLNNMSKIKLSEVTNVDQAQEAVSTLLQQPTSFFVAERDTVTEIEAKGVSEMYLSDDGKLLTYLCSGAEGAAYDAYKATLDGGKIKKREKIKGGVDEWSLAVCGEHVITSKRTEEAAIGDPSYTLYVDGQTVDDSVCDWEYSEENDAFVYAVGVDPERTGNTLKQYADGKTVEIAKNVREYQVLSNGNIVYLANWDDEDRKGDLYLFTGKEALRVDEGVARLLYAYDYWNVVDNVLV